MEREEVMEILSSTASGVEDGCVVTETQWGAIRALKQRGLSHLAIARELGIDVQTVRKWLETEWSPQRRKARTAGG